MLSRRVRRAATAAVPVAVPTAMRVLFPRLAQRFGTRVGYLAGFGIYYAGCVGLTLTLAEPAELRRLLNAPGRLPSPRSLSTAALLVPPLGGFFTQVIPHWRDADPVVIASALSIASVNATAEELLWHGLPLSVFGDDARRGWLWPGLGFTAWHLAPLSVRPAPHKGQFLLGAGIIGLGFGWVAQRTSSLRLVLACHIATDAMGLRAAAFWLGRG